MIRSYIYLVGAAIFGVFFPTSMSGEISSYLSFFLYTGSSFLLLISLRLNNWQWNRMAYLLLLAVILLFFTIISPFSYIAYGALAPYVLASLVLLTDFRSIQDIRYFSGDKLLLLVIGFINVLILAIGFGILLDNKFAIEIIQKYYQSFDELFEQMIVWYSKPVTVFGSHSTASFAYFALFAINLKIALNVNLGRAWRFYNLISAFGFVVLNWFLLSNTSFVMAVFMAIMFAFNVRKKLPNSLKLIIILLLALGGLVLLYELNIFQIILGESRDNGFASRYNSGGRLQGTYDYLFDNYFIPIGISYSPIISLGDNFIGEYILRISLVGYFIILTLLWSWFRRHLDFQVAIVFFGFFLLADLAYPLLVYGRVAASLPFYLLLWRRLDSNYFLKNSIRNKGIYLANTSIVTQK